MHKCIYGVYNVHQNSSFSAVRDFLYGIFETLQFLAFKEVKSRAEK